MTPKVALRLIEDRHTVVIESGAGERAGFEDNDYRDAGVDVSLMPYDGADLVLVVGPPPPDQAALIPRGAALIGFLDPFASPDLVKVLIERNITAFAIGRVEPSPYLDPRSTTARDVREDVAPFLRERCGQLLRCSRRVGETASHSGYVVPPECR